MIKDPNHNEETPYEILDLPPMASINDVKKSLPKFMKNPKNRSRNQDAQQARRILLNNEKRMGLDVLFYDIGEIDPDKIKTGDINEIVSGLLKVPQLQEDELFTDIDRNDLKKEIRPMCLPNVIFKNDIKYEDTDLIKLDTDLIAFEI